jgi:flavin reductase (DIM6/NTAB) family NADH-FMN oxidoreductase RutF
MRVLPVGVVMVTVSVEGRPWGLTVSSCTSLTADPPQILVSLGTRTVTCREIGASGTFGVSVLAADHLAVAMAGAAAGRPKFVDGYCDEPERGSASPRVRGSVYHLDCRSVGVHEHADHSIVIGAVTRALAPPDGPGEPLIYFDRAFRRVGEHIHP